MGAHPEALNSVRGRVRSGKKALIGVAIVVFAIVFCAALFFCEGRVELARDGILNRFKEEQTGFAEQKHREIRVWRNEMINQGRYVSSSDLFRRFINGVRNLPPDKLAELSQPDALYNSDADIRVLSGQLSKIRGVLKSCMTRRSWADARLLTPTGASMVEPSFSSPLAAAQIAISRRAAQTRLTVFGPIRQTDNGYYIDMADPVFEEAGTGNKDAVIGVFFASLPLDQPLMAFLSLKDESSEDLVPAIVNQEGASLFAVFSQNGKLIQGPVYEGIEKIANETFAEREALTGRGNAYSMGIPLLDLNWIYFVETPATKVNRLLGGLKKQIYGVGILASIVAAMLASWLWSHYTGRRQKEDAQRYEKLWRVISEQKLVLDSVYASFKAAILLLDYHGNIKLANPLFGELFDKRDVAENAPLGECIPADDAIKIIEYMRYARDADSEASLELTLPTYGINKDGTPEDRLYRVTLYPYSEGARASSAFKGCVIIFKDITKFRQEAIESGRQKEIAMERQEALIQAFVRAVESVDPHLAGHTEKMAGLADLLAKELLLTPEETETLQLAAKLSQLSKIFIPSEILLKRGTLTPAEKRKIDEAALHANRTLDGLRFDLPVAETVRFMSERVDGTGKPKGLRGEEISLPGRALAVINAFVAMTSARVYRDGEKLTRLRAMETLRRDSGFDETVVIALESVSPKDLDKILGTEDSKGRNSPE
ncbi:MAG: hypothetical protein K2H64_05040 [Desulfovibrio sp.]|nr:hypothetical protein [Desulfovibrio sp.]